MHLIAKLKGLYSFKKKIFVKKMSFCVYGLKQLMCLSKWEN